ncbi:unnamed protein product, partial [Gongylonema pulchrum]|uniref:RING-type domain-containing protein n=1 Tax=Gongylonema pulchrum TaxID=637853 RepID=A0A183DAX2_9BILA
MASDPSLGRFILDCGKSCIASIQSSWILFARHLMAVLLYLFALIQCPGMLDITGWDRHGLARTTFLLLLCCACCFHYAISAGRVDIDWINGRFYARGCLVRSSRRAHRVILVLSLAVSSAAILQTSTFHLLIGSKNFYSAPVDSSSAAVSLSILRMDFFLSLLFAIYTGVRLTLEPTGLLKRPRNFFGASFHHSSNHHYSTVPNAPATVTVKKEPQLLQECCKSPEYLEECNICRQQIADRQTSCGGVLCCVCLMDFL